jgi:nicotinamidase-related amidase
MKSDLSETSKPFLAYVESWLQQIPTIQAKEIFAQPDTCVITAVDIINGFIRFGALASPRVEPIIKPVTRLMQTAWDSGVTKILHMTDRHEPDALEFKSYPPHCLRDTAESEPVDELKTLPFANHIQIIPKNTVASGLQTEFEDWVIVHPEVETFVVVGDVTDICVYQLAMYLQLDANARHLTRRVIIPENCVQTFDRPASAAQKEGGFAHDGDLLHAVFLYHMASNGIEVVKAIV